MIVRYAPLEHGRWLANRAGTSVYSGLRMLEALGSTVSQCSYCGQQHGEILGIVGYTNWTPNAVTVHVALAVPFAAKALLIPAFHYPFVVHGRKLVVANVLSTNAASQKLCRRLGFREAYRVEKGWDDQNDIIFYEMRREECHWLEVR